MCYRGDFGLGTEPVEKGQEYGVEVTELVKRGDGIDRAQGFIIFVAGTEIGQKKRLQITNIGQRYVKADLL